MAANPLTGRSDPSVEWYEKLVLWEQGKLAEAPQPAFPEGGNPLLLLEAMARSEAEEEEEDAPTLSLDGTVLSVEALAAHSAKSESAEYQNVWDADGRPLRTGPPTTASYYASRDQSPEERSATRDQPYLLNGDDSVQKWIEREGTSLKPTSGSLVTCHLIKRHVDGSICATTYDGEPLSLKLFCDEDRNSVPGADRYVQGLHEGLSSMRLGEKAHFVVCPEKAYGLKGLYPTIPDASAQHPRGHAVCYEVELITIEEDATTQQVADPQSFFLLQRPDGYDWTGLTATSTEKACGFCGRPERALHQRSFRKCGRCKSELYCSKACATKAWPGHKLICAAPEDHLVLEAEAVTDALVLNREDAICAYVSTKLERPPKILVIVAYRNQLPLQDRQPQLFKFVPYMIAFLGSARPACEFKIVIATQTDDGRKFNRGRLMNAAFKDMQGEDFDSVIFHDVDLLPSEELRPYYCVPPCGGRPCHLGGRWRSKYSDDAFVGGAIAFTPKDFIKINGFANDNWGWGLDDEELGLRMAECGLRVVKPSVGSYCDLDPINLKNIVQSDERGYYNEWWNMDMENGKCSPKLGPIDWTLYKQWFRERGLCDVGGHSELVARTHEFGGRVVRLLYAVENDAERKEGTVALVSARLSMRACLDARLTGPVADAALATTRSLAAMGNLDPRRARVIDVKLLAPEQKLALRDGPAERPRRRLAM